MTNRTLTKKVIMKKVSLFVLLSFMAILVFAQRNSFYYGDKNIENSRASLETISQEIEFYQLKIDKINKENDKLFVRFEKTTNANVRESIRKRVVKNDSLIVIYQDLLLQNEKTRSNLSLYYAEKENLAFVKSTGNNPVKLQAAAEAYAVMRYADGYRYSVSNTKDELTGIVINQWYKDVHVVVYGPANFSKEFYLKSNGGKESFDLSVPGNYTAVFSSGNEKRVVNKKVLPNPNSYSTYEGEKFNFSAMLLRR